MNKSGLVTRLAIIITFAAAVVGFLSTQVFYRITYLHELEISKQEIVQLNTTVSATTSIASYLEDEELLKEVVNGLVSNSVVSSVGIKTKTLSIASTNHQIDDNSIEFQLFSPFEKDREVGSLLITPNIDHIQSRAEQISNDNVIAIAVQASIVTLVVIFVSVVIITTPIIKIAKQLHQITPGTSARLDIPLHHHHSELGTLVSDINSVLIKTEQHIKDERMLRTEVEKLGKNFHMLFENSTSPIILTEPKGDILLYNQAFLKLLERINVPFKKNYGPYLSELFLEPESLNNRVEIAFGNSEIASGEFKLQPSESSEQPIWVQAIISSSISDDYKEHYQITLHDISKRKLQLEDLDLKANTDELTQLLNRRGSEQTLTKFINSKTPFALIMMDLNKFKPINDIYGHDAGDEILIHIANQLTVTLRRRDLLSRWGGDEFVIILPNLTQQEVVEVAIKINESIKQSYFLEKYNKEVSVGCSMGAAFYPEDNQDLASLIACADKAMYYAKESHNNTFFCLYGQLLNEKKVE